MPYRLWPSQSSPLPSGKPPKGLFIAGEKQRNSSEKIAADQARNTQESLRIASINAEAAMRAAKVAEIALESAETPYLVPIVKPYDVRTDPMPPSPEMQALISLRFENCGRSPATVLETRVDKGTSNRTPSPSHFPPLETNLMHSYILPQGRESEPMRYTVGGFGDWTPANQEKVAWINGHVRYADLFGNQFITRFCYYRHPYQGRWLAYGGPDHNVRQKLTGVDLQAALVRDRGRYQADLLE